MGNACILISTCTRLARTNQRQVLEECTLQFWVPLHMYGQSKTEVMKELTKGIDTALKR